MAIDFKNAASAFAASSGTTENRGYSTYPFWKMATDETATVRFIPDANEDNPLRFLTKRLFHNMKVNGQWIRYTCPKQHDIAAECPSCKLSAEFYEADDKVMGRRFYRQADWVGRILVVKDPKFSNDVTEEFEGKVVDISIGKQVFNAINQALASGELEDWPSDFKNGLNFNIKKVTQGAGSDDAQNNYSYSSFARKVTEIEPLELVDLATLSFQAKTKEEIESMVQIVLAASTGGRATPATGSATPASDVDALKAKMAAFGSASTAAPATTPVTETASKPETPVVDPAVAAAQAALAAAQKTVDDAAAATKVDTAAADAKVDAAAAPSSEMEDEAQALLDQILNGGT
jgi:hypothetical protein